MSRAPDPERDAHKAWLGLVQPVGLVVSPPALLKAQVILDRNVAPLQQALLGVLGRQPGSPNAQSSPSGAGSTVANADRLLDFPAFAGEVLGWSMQDLAGALGGPQLPDSLTVALPDYGDVLTPTYAVLDGMDGGRVLMLVVVTAPGVPLDVAPSDSTNGWVASPHARFERLLRETHVQAGLLCNGDELRLVYAPRGESSGTLAFPVPPMATVAGRPLLAAAHMLLSEHRVFGAPDKQRLLDLLADSRKYQNEVSGRLADQVLGALWELLRGIQSADAAAGGAVLWNLAADAPDTIYGGLLTVVMRLVFLLYAEDQGLMPNDPVYAQNYAIGGLYERLREDAGRHPDTMDQRFGAWAWLLSTFRLVYDGGAHGGFQLPARHGQLFDPDAYPFLEGRPPGVLRVRGQTFEAPRVPDGVLWRVLERLLVLDGERLSYRALDVEQVGSVYESMMGFDVRSVEGRALAVGPKRIVIDVDELLRQPGGRRAAWLKDAAECDLPAASSGALAGARTAEDVVAALGRRVARETPTPLPPGALFLQPGEERRRSGSHYTPRELTEPIVRTTLGPVLDALGPRPRPEQILGLKVCDPAMGSGAFLVEACRQLATALVTAWEQHEGIPKLPPDEDPLLHARRLVAQRCLYGVDKNPFAVSLARLSLWLVTLARDHAFTFLDHALRHGDSLVGLSKAQLRGFRWVEESTALDPLGLDIDRNLHAAASRRAALQAEDDADYDGRYRRWSEAELDMADLRLIGDVCVAAYFGAEKDKDREVLRRAFRARVDAWRVEGDPGRRAELREALEAIQSGLRHGARSVPPLHWEIEFPEVFGQCNPGFDVMVGNPPFLGGRKISGYFGGQYLAWLTTSVPEGGGQADLVAYFFRRAFSFLCGRGTLGMLSTNSISEGDTRRAGIGPICTRLRGHIYAARRRVPWPGAAAVVVSMIHVGRGPKPQCALLDDSLVPQITAYLFHQGGSEEPFRLSSSRGMAFKGQEPYGRGFIFSESDEGTNPVTLARALLKSQHNQQVIRPLVGGEEVLEATKLIESRYIIDFGDKSEEEARSWPDLFLICQEKVLTERADKAKEVAAWPFWRFWRTRSEFRRAAHGLDYVMMHPFTSKHSAFVLVPGNWVISSPHVAFASNSMSLLAICQSRIHERWARFFSSSHEDRLRYTPSDCFETFPFPPNWENDPSLEAAGQHYYEYRAALMVRNDEGLTKTYNRFHDPNEHSPEIEELRHLHAEMDRAVLHAYGWTDIDTRCEFLLDYAIDEETWGSKKKPYRYRWPEAVHDEVLARLLELNQKRHAEEVCAAPAKAKAPPAKKATKAPKTPAGSGTLDLFSPPERTPRDDSA